MPELMTDQVGLARCIESGFAKSVANVRATNRVKVGHADGAAIKITSAEHLHQIPLDTLLGTDPVAANLVEQSTCIGRGVRVAGIASDDHGGNGVGDVDFWFVVEPIHIIDVGVDLGFRITAIVLIELVVHIAGQLTFVQQSAQEA